MSSFKELDVWKRALDVTVRVYACTKEMPKEELYGLADQLKRSAVSIPSNIAEGQKRFTRQDQVHFMGIALGSAAELETQLIIIQRVFDINTSELQEECEIISRMLKALIKSLRSEI